MFFIFHNLLNFFIYNYKAINIINYIIINIYFPPIILTFDIKYFLILSRIIYSFKFQLLLKSQYRVNMFPSNRNNDNNDKCMNLEFE